jgi:hypothetical protein
METDPVSGIPDDGQSQKNPVILYPSAYMRDEGLAVSSDSIAPSKYIN